MAHPTFVFKRTYLALRRAMDAALAEHGLTAAQADVIFALCQADGLEHRMLQDQLGVSSPTLTNILDGMQARGWIVRRASTSDSRVKRIYLAHKAKALQVSGALDRAGRAFTRRMLHGLDARQRKDFMGALAVIEKNLGRVGKQEAAHR